jgi:glucose-6-phosphate 1-dehydrogenase
MVKRGVLNVPVIGVAASPWSVAQLRKRVTQSLRHSGTAVNRRNLRILLSLMQYVSGDYNNRETFKALKLALGNAQHPAY